MEKEIPSWVHQLLKDEVHDTFFITGGWGAAKSTGTAVAFFYRILTNPKAKHWWIVSPTHNIATDAILPTCTFVLDHFFGKRENIDYTIYRSKPVKIKFNDSKQFITLHSGDRPERMVAATIAGYWITEAGLQKEQTFDNMIARARDRRADRVIGIIEGTPEGDGPYREMADFHKTKPELGHRRFILHTEDNREHLAENYIRKIEARFARRPEKLKSYLYGLFASFNKGTAYWEYRDKLVIDPVAADPNIDLKITFDFNVSPLAWVALQKQKFITGIGRNVADRVIAIEESSGKSRGLLDAVAEFIVAFPPDVYSDTPILIDGGHDGHSGSFRADNSAFSEIKRLLQSRYSSVRVVANVSAPKVVNRLTRINNLFAYSRFLICSNCTKLMKAYGSTSTKPGTWELLKRTGDNDTSHYSDASDYGVLNTMKGVTLTEDSDDPITGFDRI